MAEGEPRVALLAGASGFVGNFLLEALLEAPDISRVYAVTRRPLGREHPHLANRIVQFDKIESQMQGFTCHFAFCCLGTTLRQAGSEQAFRKAEIDSVMAFARAAKTAKAQRFVVVSSVGADPAAKIFYLRIKGEIEQALSDLAFPALDILQPGVLLGWRREMRPLEMAARAVMPLVNPFMTGAREAYRGIPARTVAAAMLGLTRSGRRGLTRHTYSGIEALSRIKPLRVMGVADPKAQSKPR